MRVCVCLLVYVLVFVRLCICVQKTCAFYLQYMENLKYLICEFVCVREGIKTGLAFRFVRKCILNV